MNKERLLEVAAVLRSGEYSRASFDGQVPGFDMSYEFCRIDRLQQTHGCGTVMCIAGFAAAMYDPDGLEAGLVRSDSGLRRGLYGTSGVSHIAGKALDLTGEEAEALFYPANPAFYAATAEMAAGVLEHFAETGVVLWTSTEDNDWFDHDAGAGGNSL
jgi:hypothetical protein